MIHSRVEAPAVPSISSARDAEPEPPSDVEVCLDILDHDEGGNSAAWWD